MTVSRILITLGLIFLIAGLSVSFFEDKFKWFGNMPLDLNFKNKVLHYKIGDDIRLIIEDLILILEKNKIEQKGNKEASFNAVTQ